MTKSTKRALLLINEARLFNKSDLTITNQDMDVITESAFMIKELENKGYTVTPFADDNTKLFGIKVSWS